MKQLDEVGFKDISELVMQYQAFIYTFKHSMMNDPEDTDHDQLIKSFEEVLSTEDRILETGWLFTEIQEDFNTE